MRRGRIFPRPPEHSLPVPADLVQVFAGRDLTGDGVMKLPFVRALRRAWPRARIEWITAGSSVFASTLAPLMPGLLDAVIEDTGIGVSWAGVFRPRADLRRADLLIDTQRQVRTSLALSRLRPRIFVSAAAGWLLSARAPLDRPKPASMLGQMMQLIAACGANANLSYLPALRLPASLEEEAARRLPGGKIPLVGLAPGAGDRRKCWPLERFLGLGAALGQRGLAPVVLLGPAEREWSERVAHALPSALLPVRTEDSPLMTMAIARRLALAVANDAGVGHIIAAAGTPLVSLFGPTSPEKFAPQATRLTILRAQDHGAAAMDAIPEAAVLEAVLTALR
ncbi:MAG TPA: glycosyltransferase family 9 protein [Acetobacteraceae bacterium]|nr:glycosyltransferase family 9 protein [Acetobacteraceae bacterium]